MHATSVSYILIAVLLACPYLCSGEAVSSESAPCLTGTCCCSHQQDRSSRDAPQPADDYDSNCLCQGAIIDGVRTVESDQATRLAIDSLGGVAAGCPNRFNFSAISFELPHQFPPFSTGRDVCALNCARLL